MSDNVYHDAMNEMTQCVKALTEYNDKIKFDIYLHKVSTTRFRVLNNISSPISCQTIKNSRSKTGVGATTTTTATKGQRQRCR